MGDEKIDSTHFVKIVSESFRTLIVHHRPSKTNGITKFSSRLRAVLDCFDPNIVTGDFNTELTKSNMVTKLFATKNFVRLTGEYTTRSFTCIDGVFAKDSKVSGYVLESVFSFHRPILASYKLTDCQ